MQGTKALSSLALAARGTMLVNVEREAGNFCIKLAWRGAHKSGYRGLCRLLCGAVLKQAGGERDKQA